MFYLRKKYRRSAYEIAAFHWNEVNREHPDWSDQKKRRFARVAIHRDLADAAETINERDGFGSLLTSIIVSLMVKFAFRLLEKWIQNRLASVGSKYHE
jgi:hypothetical protein